MGLEPGDLLLTRSSGWAGWFIRLGAALRNRPNLHNHVAVVHHTDKTGTIWVIEGRPGGVGWRDATAYLKSPYTVCNSAQPKSPGQRKLVAEGAEKMLGTAYDWAAIAADAGESVGLGKVWELRWPGQGVPGQVVCSSLADWLYSKVKLENPEAEREVAPADWLELWIRKGWAARPK